MTRRERLEARIARREEWAASRARRSAAAFERARTVADGIPLGQPILVGHHSEGRHRRDIARIDAGMREGCESAAMATHHESKAAGLAHQLERSIFDDDPDALERLAEKLAGLEVRREELRKLGAAWRKAKRPKADDAEGWARVAGLLGLPADASIIREGRLSQARDFADRGPVPSYVLQNLGGNITRCRERIEGLKRRAATMAEVEACGGARLQLVGDASEHAVVTFADYPGRDIVAALKDAGFWWCRPSWHGPSAKLPDAVRELVAPKVGG